MNPEREVLRHAAGQGIPPWWATLVQSANCTSIFLSDAWLQTWLEVFGAGFHARWCSWKVDGRVVAGCLLLSNVSVRKRVLPLRALYVNATGRTFPTAGFNEIVCVGGHETAVAADFAKWLRSLPWDQLALNAYAEGGLLDAVMGQLPVALVEREARPAPFVDLRAVAATGYENSLSGNSRSQIRRSRRLFTERSGPPVVTRAATLPEAQRYLAELARLHNARWEARGGVGSFGQPGVMDFHTRLLPRLWERDAVDLLRVHAGEEDIGYLYNFRIGDTVCFFQSGFVYQEDARYKPGLVTHTVAIEHYIGKGLAEYDFLPGDARYKRSLAKQERTRYWTVAYRDRAWIRGALWARDMMRKRNPASEKPAAAEHE